MKGTANGQATATEEYDQTKNVYVRNFDLEVTDEMLNDAFKDFGTIMSCVVAKNKDGKSRGFGFVAYETTEETQKAIKGMNGKKVWGSNLYVAQFQKKEERVAMLTAEKTSTGKALEEATAPAAPTQKEFDEDKNVYVRNLCMHVQDHQLKAKFQEFGEIESCFVNKNDKGLGRQYGLVYFTTTEAAQRAIKAMNGAPACGKVLYVAKAQKKTDRVAMLAEQLASLKIRQEPRLFIKNVHVNVTDMALKNFFSQYGEVVEAEVQLHKSCISKGLALVKFKEYADAEAAVVASRKGEMNELLGKKLIVSFDKGRPFQQPSQQQDPSQCAFPIPPQSSVEGKKPTTSKTSEA
uniref:Polyadenylate-binding protein n=1 Tax=Steinernema glaseri TaxID=37863 RepID=A0A1I7ZUN7_9BILA